MGRDRPRTGLSPVLPRRGRSPRRPTPNDQSSLVTEEEASRLPHRAVRGHRQVGRTQSEVVQGSTANGSQDVFGAAPFTTTHLPANQLQQGSHDDDFDPRAPPSSPPPPESKGNPPLEEIPPNFPPPPPGFADQEFEDFFIASEEPNVTMTTTEPQSKPHTPQPSKGFGDAFSDHPVSAFTSEVTSDVIQVGDQRIPPVCSPDPFGAPRFVQRPPATSRPHPPSQSENRSEDITAPNTTQTHSRHQRKDSFGLTPFVEQGSGVKGHPLQVSSEVKGQSSDPSATNSPDPVYTTVTKKPVKQEDPFGLSPFTAEERQHPSPKQAPVVSQSPLSPPSSVSASHHKSCPSLTPGSRPRPVCSPTSPPGSNQTNPRGDQQGVQYHSSSPWQQGADSFGAIPFVSMATKDN